MHEDNGVGGARFDARRKGVGEVKTRRVVVEELHEFRVDCGHPQISMFGVLEHGVVEEIEAGLFGVVDDINKGGKYFPPLR